MKRGQAFETMMLVISVIVALAILGVLTGIIQNIGPIGTNDPKVVIKDGLKAVQTRGFDVISPKTARLNKGDMILKGTFTSELGISGDYLNFFVHSDLDTRVETTGDNLNALENTVVEIAVCGNTERSENPKYCVAVAPERQRSAATDLCIQSCGLS